MHNVMCYTFQRSNLKQWCVYYVVLAFVKNHIRSGNCITIIKLSGMNWDGMIPRTERRYCKWIITFNAFQCSIVVFIWTTVYCVCQQQQKGALLSHTYHIHTHTSIPTMSSKAVVRINEMEPEMAEEAFIAAMDALEQQYNESDIANQVKERFEEKYGGLWHCFVGRNFGAFVTHEEKKIIYFYIQQTGFLLFGTV